MTYVVRNGRLTKSGGTPTFGAMSASEYIAPKSRGATFGAISDAEMAKNARGANKMANNLNKEAVAKKKKKKQRIYLQDTKDAMLKQAQEIRKAKGLDNMAMPAKNKR